MQSELARHQTSWRWDSHLGLHWVHGKRMQDRKRKHKLGRSNKMLLHVSPEFTLVNVKCCPFGILTTCTPSLCSNNPNMPFPELGEDQVIVVPLSMRIASPGSKTEMSPGLAASSKDSSPTDECSYCQSNFSLKCSTTHPPWQWHIRYLVTWQSFLHYRAWWLTICRKLKGVCHRHCQIYRGGARHFLYGGE